MGCHYLFASPLQSAIALYRGPFLDSFSLADSPTFEQWVLQTREQLSRRVLKALSTLVEYHTAREEYEQALPYAYRGVELEPWREEAHQQLMRLLALRGERSAALAQFEKCRQALAEELGVEPGAATVTLYEQIRDGKLETIDKSKREETIPPLTVQPAPKHNLPQQVTRFFGRESEIAQVKERLAEWRLVTLTGAGGVGKTRLSVQVAEEILDDFPDGVRYVELAPLSDPETVVGQVASSLGLSEDTGVPSWNLWLSTYTPARSCWCWITASTCWRPAPGWQTPCCVPARG